MSKEFYFLYPIYYCWRLAGLLALLHLFFRECVFDYDVMFLILFFIQLTVVSGGRQYKLLHFITLVSFKYSPFNALFITTILCYFFFIVNERNGLSPLDNILN
jgi:hypothetical protein